MQGCLRGEVDWSGSTNLYPWLLRCKSPSNYRYQLLLFQTTWIFHYFQSFSNDKPAYTEYALLNIEHLRKYRGVLYSIHFAIRQRRRTSLHFIYISF